MTDFLNKHRKSKLLRACSPGKFFWILGFLSYSHNNYIYWLHVQTIFNLESFPFFFFLIYYEKSDQGGSMPKFRQCLSAHGYSFGPHFTRLIQSKVLTLVKLSLLVCMCVCFFFTFANWFTALRQIKDGPIGTLMGCGQEVSPYLALILFDLDLQDL